MEYQLTEYEARTYLALMHLGVAAARDVANLSRVPRTKIYSVLDDLHAKQLAEIIPERPKKYCAVPFSTYMGTFEREYQAKLKKLDEDKKFLMSSFNSRAGVQAADLGKPGTFRVLKGRKNVFNMLYEMIGRASAEVLEMGTESSVVRMGYYMPMLVQKAREGVAMKLVAPVTDRNSEHVGEFRKFGTVHPNPTKSPGSAMLIVDDAEVLICHYVPDDDHLFKGEDIAIWSDDKAIVRDMKATILAHRDFATQALMATVQDPGAAPATGAEAPRPVPVKR